MNNINISLIEKIITYNYNEFGKEFGDTLVDLKRAYINQQEILNKIKECIEKENEYLEKAKEMYVECENEDIKIHTIQLINNSIVANYELLEMLVE